jgi:hypothetical protein
VAQKEKNPLKPLSIGKLRKDLQLIMDEIDRTHGVLPDYYSPVMWQRLQNTAEKVSDAIQAVRMKLSGMTTPQIADKLELKVAQVAGYIAWNTMLDPEWLKPQIVVSSTACPSCGAAPGEHCNYASAPGHKLHPARREAFKNSRSARSISQQKPNEWRRTALRERAQRRRQLHQQQSEGPDQPPDC